MASVISEKTPAARRLVYLTSVMSRTNQYGKGNTLLFDPSILQMIDWQERKATYKGNRSPDLPGDNLLLRPLALEDYGRGFLKILSQLTETGIVTGETFAERFQRMRSCPGTYYVLVVEDTARDQVIGTSTLVIEQKFIHGAGMRGRIEDVVVSEDYRGLELGKLLVETLTLLSKKIGCYKISLECADKNVKFYEALGYNVDKERFMVQRFKA